jgi:hypothetical protein
MAAVLVDERAVWVDGQKFGSMGGQFGSQAVSRENLTKVAYFPKGKASFLRKYEGDRGVTSRDHQRRWSAFWAAESRESAFLVGSQIFFQVRILALERVAGDLCKAKPGRPLLSDGGCCQISLLKNAVWRPPVCKEALNVHVTTVGRVFLILMIRSIQLTF